jgi:2-aminoadipate transaminase
VDASDFDWTVSGQPIWYACPTLLGFNFALNSASAIPLYRQLAESIRGAISAGRLIGGTRLPATRELASTLGLNRTTVSAAYAVLEQDGLLRGLVGKGSFVVAADSPIKEFDWEAILTPLEVEPPSADYVVSFANSRPAQECFPMEQFRRLAKDVIDGPQAREILQLGSPYGYPPLRRFLLSEGSAGGFVGPNDDVIVTNGCQQALDLLARVLIDKREASVLLEDPVYRGLLRVFGRTCAQIHSLPFSAAGIDIGALENLAAHQRPRVLVLTPDFQNPTGVTLSLEQRKAVIALAQRFAIAIVEINIYRDLRYQGSSLPTMKQLDESGSVISIGSYSKVAFPGLRVGWVIAPRPVIARLAEAKQTSDLHSDQLAQAVLLRFAESGELARYLEQTRRVGAERLEAALETCGKAFPPGVRYTRPEGGMNLWVELPPPLLAEEVLKSAREYGVHFLPGSYFSLTERHRRSFRLSFGGLAPKEIIFGIEKLGAVALAQLRSHTRATLEPRAAFV